MGTCMFLSLLITCGTSALANTLFDNGWKDWNISASSGGVFIVPPFAYAGDDFGLDQESILDSLTVFTLREGDPQFVGGYYAIYSTITQNKVVDITANVIAGNPLVEVAVNNQFIGMTGDTTSVHALTFNLGGITLPKGNYFVAWGFSSVNAYAIQAQGAFNANGLQWRNDLSFWTDIGSEHLFVISGKVVNPYSVTVGKRASDVGEFTDLFQSATRNEGNPDWLSTEAEQNFNYAASPAWKWTAKWNKNQQKIEGSLALPSGTTLDVASGEFIYVEVGVLDFSDIKFGVFESCSVKLILDNGTLSSQDVVDGCSVTSNTTSVEFNKQWATEMQGVRRISIEIAYDTSSDRICGSAYENSVLSLACPAGEVISEINFASFGRPEGSCSRGYSIFNCHSSNSLYLVNKTCIGRSACSVNAVCTIWEDWSEEIFSDPKCFDKPALGTLAVEATCITQPSTNGTLPTTSPLIIQPMTTVDNVEDPDASSAWKNKWTFGGIVTLAIIGFLF